MVLCSMWYHQTLRFFFFLLKGRGYARLQAHTRINNYRAPFREPAMPYMMVRRVGLAPMTLGVDLSTYPSPPSPSFYIPSL